MVRIPGIILRCGDRLSWIRSAGRNGACWCLLSLALLQLLCHMWGWLIALGLRVYGPFCFLKIRPGNHGLQNLNYVSRIMIFPSEDLSHQNWPPARDLEPGLGVPSKH